MMFSFFPESLLLVQWLQSHHGALVSLPILLSQKGTSVPLSTIFSFGCQSELKYAFWSSLSFFILSLKLPPCCHVAACHNAEQELARQLGCWEGTQHMFCFP